MRWLKTIGILTTDERLSLYWVFITVFGFRMWWMGDIQWPDVAVFAVLAVAIGLEGYFSAQRSQIEFDAHIDRISARLAALEEMKVRMERIDEEQKIVREEQGKLSLGMLNRR
jgi:hypothetical protein